MTIAQIETNLQELINFFSAQTFTIDLLLAYGFPKSTLARLEKGDLNLLESKCKQHSRKILAQLYNPDKMPVDLKNAHYQLDLAIERCYRAKPFESDEERLEYLFGLYEEMVVREKIAK